MTHILFILILYPILVKASVFETVIQELLSVLDFPNLDQEVFDQRQISISDSSDSKRYKQQDFKVQCSSLKLHACCYIFSFCESFLSDTAGVSRA